MAFKYSDEYKLYEKQSALDQKYYNQQQKQLNQWNMESAKKQMDFQKTMSDTAHQREVKDLIKAGLNPVLSATNGASTPSGAYANIDSQPLSAASQSRIANRQIAKELTMNRQNMANSMKIAKYQAKMQYAAQKYATDMSYQLGMAGLDNQMNMALLPYENVNATNRYQWDNTSADTSYKVDNPTTVAGIVTRTAQGIIDAVFGTQGKTIRQASGLLTNPFYLVKRGLTYYQLGKKLGNSNLGKVLANNISNAKQASRYLQQRKVDLSSYVGDIGYIPQGRLYHKNGTPYTDAEMRKLTRLYSDKTKLGYKNKSLFNALYNNQAKRNYINKAKNR